MDKDFLYEEVGAVLDNLTKGLENETSKEYVIAVNNVSKLHKMLSDERDYELKQARDESEETLKRNQFDLESQKFELEKMKFEQMKLDKIRDREIESKRIEYQHEERMGEIRVNQIKAENEKKILEQNQMKMEKEFKANRRRDRIMFVTKIFTGLLLTGVAVLMHKDEIRFERDENGIVPQRCKTYDAVVNRASEMVLG